jgi:hypothetical protein
MTVLVTIVRTIIKMFLGMICNIMSYCVMLCYSILYNVIVCYVIMFDDISCYVMACFILSNQIMLKCVTRFNQLYLLQCLLSSYS